MKLKFQNANGNFVLDVNITKEGLMYTGNGVLVGNVNLKEFPDALEVFKTAYGDRPAPQDYDVDWDYIYA